MEKGRCFPKTNRMTIKRTPPRSPRKLAATIRVRAGAEKNIKNVAERERTLGCRGCAPDNFFRQVPILVGCAFGPAGALPQKFGDALHAFRDGVGRIFSGNTRTLRGRQELLSQCIAAIVIDCAGFFYVNQRGFNSESVGMWIIGESLEATHTVGKLMECRLVRAPSLNSGYGLDVCSTHVSLDEANGQKVRKTSCKDP